MDVFQNALASGPGRFIERALRDSQVLSMPSMPNAWDDRDDREASVEFHVRHRIAWQIRVNREERGLNQATLAALMKTGQSAVCKLENPDGGDVRVSTLVKAAHAFDCALLVSFVPFSEFAVAAAEVRPERLLACSYEAERVPSTKWAARSPDQFQALT